MIRKCGLLLKMQLYGLFGINKVMHTKNPKEKRKLMYWGAGAALIAVMMGFYSFGIGYGCVRMGMAKMLPSLLVLAAALITLVTTVLKSSAVLFGYRDYDMVMSLPVSSRTVVISRLLMIYGLNVLVTVIAAAPALIVFGVCRGVSAGIWVMLFISIFLMPLFPLILSVAVGALITYLSWHFKYRNLVVIVLSIGATIGIMALSMQLNEGSMDALASLGAKTADETARFYPLAGWFSNAVIKEDWLSFGLFAIVSVGAASAFVLLFSGVYTKMSTAFSAEHTKGDYRMGTLQAASPLFSLYKKELKRLFSCSIYMLNSTISAVLLLAASISVLFVDISKMEQMLGINGLSEWYGKIIPFGSALLVGMSSTTACSISLEGKNRWILLSAPVEAKMIFKAKIGVNLTILLPIVLVSSVLFTLGFKPGFTDMLFMFVIPAVYAFFISVLGLFVDLHHPKYDWETEYRVVKGSLSVLFVILAGMAASILPAGLMLVLNEYALVIRLGTAAAVLALTWILYSRLDGRKLYRE